MTDERENRLLQLAKAIVDGIKEGIPENELDQLVLDATQLSGNPRFSAIIFQDDVLDPEEIVRRAMAYKPIAL